MRKSPLQIRLTESKNSDLELLDIFSGIYIDVAEVLELCRKLMGGELRYMMQSRKKSGDSTPLYQCLGGTSAEKLARYGHARTDGKSLSRTAQLVCGSKTDFLFVADSGPGEANAKGLIVPRFGKNPENHVSVSMTFELFSELMLMTKIHYQSWLTAQYLREPVKPSVQLTQTSPPTPGKAPSKLF